MYGTYALWLLQLGDFSSDAFPLPSRKSPTKTDGFQAQFVATIAQVSFISYSITSSKVLDTLCLAQTLTNALQERYQRQEFLACLLQNIWRDWLHYLVKRRQDGACDVRHWHWCGHHSNTACTYTSTPKSALTFVLMALVAAGERVLAGLRFFRWQPPSAATADESAPSRRGRRPPALPLPPRKEGPRRCFCCAEYTYTGKKNQYHTVHTVQ